MWTVEFQLDKKFDNDHIKGWVIEPDIFSAKNVVADLESITFINDYIMKFKFKLPNKKKRTTFYDLDIDTMNVILQNYQDSAFIKKNSFFLSYRSQTDIIKVISFAPKRVLNPDKDIAYGIYLTEEVDSLILQFDVILREAEYFSYVDKTLANIEMDSLRIIENRGPIIVPVELRLHKYVSKM